jgi:hypothetical protein
MVCITTISVWQILRHTMTGSLVNDELGSFREKKAATAELRQYFDSFLEMWRKGTATWSQDGATMHTQYVSLQPYQ